MMTSRYFLRPKKSKFNHQTIQPAEKALPQSARQRPEKECLPPHLRFPQDEKVKAT